ncbi:MAG TPA: alkaline phosphatase family protein [Candidatus Polarisedimenticolia bacterium]|nr:alkaline phosphatase family protein [Candidatus Polarisedimenticolia bacterium]
MRSPALLACSLAACLLACGHEESKPGRVAPSTDVAANGARGRVVVFGIDGADWQVIEPLVAAGRLPRFKRLIEEGTTGTLLSMEPSASPSLWTTVATGVRPERHGIHGFVVEGGGGPGDAIHVEGRGGPAGRRAEVHPVTSSMRRAPAFWNILPRHGRKVGVVGWLVTWPAEETNGFIVSSYLPYIYNWSTGRPLKGTIVPGIPRQTFPESLIGSLDADKVKPGDIPKEMVRRFYDPDRARSLSKDDQACVEGFLWSLACDETYRRIGLRLFGDYPVDLFAIYFGGVDVASHRFWKFAHPSALDYHVGPEEATVLGRVIEAYYVYVDELLGEYMERIGPDTTLVVLSDHGFKPVLFPGQPATSGHHRMEGIIALYGRGVRHGHRIERAGLLDVLPTLLYLLDVPLARDLEGKALEDALDVEFVRRHPMSFVETYGAPEHAVEPDQSEVDRNVLERLRSLGYIN